MEFSRQEYWSGLLFPSPGDLPNPGIEPRSPALPADSLMSKPPGRPIERKQSLTALWDAGRGHISSNKRKDSWVDALIQVADQSLSSYYCQKLVLCSLQNLEKFIIPDVSSGSQNKKKVSQWKEKIKEQLNCRLRREWNDFFFGKYHSFLIFRVRASTINFCYQKVLFGEKKNVHFDCLFIYMHFLEKLSHSCMITS